MRDTEGNMVPGYGWIFPMGDGRVNVGVGLLSTDRRWKGVNTSHLMDAFTFNFAPKSWGLSPDTCLGPPTGGKFPMGLSVGPRSGGNVILAGDAAGSINPFNGEGIAYGYETGRLAAAAFGRALSGEGRDALAEYDRQLDDAYGAYYKVARAFVRMISNPQAMHACVGVGMQSEFVMSQLLRIMANLMRPDSAGPAEVGFQAMELVSRFCPELDKQAQISFRQFAQPMGVVAFESLGQSSSSYNSYPSVTSSWTLAALLQAVSTHRLHELIHRGDGTVSTQNERPSQVSARWAAGRGNPIDHDPPNGTDQDVVGMKVKVADAPLPIVEITQHVGEFTHQRHVPNHFDLAPLPVAPPNQAILATRCC